MSDLDKTVDAFAACLDAKLWVKIQRGLFEMFVFLQIAASRDPAKKASDDSASQTPVITTSHLLLAPFHCSGDLCLPKVSKCSVWSASTGDMGITCFL